MAERGRRGGIALAVLILALAVAGVVLARLRPDETVRIAHVLSEAGHAAGPAGWIVVAAAEVAAALCGVIPASAIAVAAGMIYGTFGGFLVCAPAIVVGALLAFGLSRSVFRRRVGDMIARDRRLAGLDAAVARDGWRLVFLLRLSPVMPFALTSYALGLTALDIGGYAFGTSASLPPLLLYTGLGSFARHGVTTVSAGNGLLRLVVPAVSLLATVLLVVRVGQLVTRSLRQTAGVLGE